MKKLHKTTKLIIIILINITLYSCTSTREIMDSWLNHTKSELVMKWGPPSRVFDNSPQGEILIYATNGFVPGMYGNPGISYWDYKYMYINKDGKIYYWRTERQAIPPQQIQIYNRGY